MVLLFVSSFCSIKFLKYSDSFETEEKVQLIIMRLYILLSIINKISYFLILFYYYN